MKTCGCIDVHVERKKKAAEEQRSRYVYVHVYKIIYIDRENTCTIVSGSNAFACGDSYSGIGELRKRNKLGQNDIVPPPRKLSRNENVNNLLQACMKVESADSSFLFEVFSHE